MFLLRALLLLCGSVFALTAAEPTFRSHPAMRALPSATTRSLDDGPKRFVDATKGDDAHEGSVAQPWKTLTHAITKLVPGETLVLRGGVYHEAITVKARGTAAKPITIRPHPGELAIIDAGYREFLEDPAHAWEPHPDGAPGEFRSTKTYTTGGGFANFADSMVPMHRYINFYDMRSTNELFRKELSDRTEDPGGMYVGPGVRRDQQTGRIHIRLAHTQLDGLGESGYRGETDPRKLPLVIAGQDYPLRLEGAQHLRLQDIVLRGGARGAIQIDGAAEAIELDGATLYGSSMALRISRVKGLRVIRCALRGHAAPWHSRFHHKNRAGSGYLVLAAGSDIEFAYSELTDHHDCIQLDHADEVRFHHNLVENFNDDGIELGPKKERGRVFIYQNRISRTLSPFTLHGKKPNPVVAEPGSGVFIYRNVVDLRRGTYRTPPEQPDPSGAFLDSPTTIIAHDHGSPTWPVAFVYHNTFLMPADGFRDYYAFTWGSHLRGTTRRLFNNIFVQMEGLPDMNFTAATPYDDFQADANLHWAVKEGLAATGDRFAKFRQSPLAVESRNQYPPGWAARDRFADPKFNDLDSDLRLRAGSPAIDGGVAVPAEWPDPLRGVDKGSPDIGALPLGAPAFAVGPSAP